MPEYPNLHPGAPLTLWMRHGALKDGWCQTSLHEPDGVEYVRKDVCDAMLTEAGRQPPYYEVLDAALCALEDNDADGAERILRTALARAPR